MPFNNPYHSVEFEVANHCTMCSTLVMGDLHNDYNPTLKNFRSGVAEFDEWSDYPVSEYAFIVATTTKSESKAERLLEKIGFDRTPRRVYNKKNGTRVHLWNITVKKFLKRLKELEND